MTPLVLEVSRRSGQPVEATLRVLQAYSEAFYDMVEKGEPIIYLHMGTFASKVKAPQQAYDFRAKKKIIAPAYSYLLYRPTKLIRQALLSKDINLGFRATGLAEEITDDA